MRAALKWFATVMEAKLQRNDHKAHWSGMTLRQLRYRLQQELGELDRALAGGDTANIILEAADVANFAMMIADNTLNDFRGVLPPRQLAVLKKAIIQAAEEK